MSRTTRNYSYYIWRYSGVVVLLCLWEILPKIGFFNPQFIPPLSRVLGQIYILWFNNALFTNIMVSLWRVLLGLIIASIIAIPIGLLLGGWFSEIADLMDPLFRIFGQVNPFSLLPMFILFFGIGETAKLAVVAWVCIWPILYNTILGARSVDKLLIKAARSMKISNWQLFKKVILPSAEPSIFAGLRVGTEMSFFMLIAAEMIGASAGLGWLFHNSAMNNQIPRMYSAGLFIVALGFLLNRFLIYIQNKLFFWKETEHGFSFAKWKKVNTKFHKNQIAILAILAVAIIGIGSYEVNYANTTEFSSRFSNSNAEGHMDMKGNMKNMNMEEDNKKSSEHMDMKKDNKKNSEHMNMEMKEDGGSNSEHMNMKK
ncbi:ABC transporter permease [Clostridium sp. WILCCON 0269]|uniref:ABC transporter permease n=1 Tax=Candidatus Clostridium eludens TaxID=3381663 RepID=A0ABW8SLA2_9CLOT